MPWIFSVYAAGFHVCRGSYWPYRGQVVVAGGLAAERDEMPLQARVHREGSALVVHRPQELDVHDVLPQAKVRAVVPPSREAHNGEEGLQGA